MEAAKDKMNSWRDFAIYRVPYALEWSANTGSASTGIPRAVPYVGRVGRPTVYDLKTQLFPVVSNFSDADPASLPLSCPIRPLIPSPDLF